MGTATQCTRRSVETCRLQPRQRGHGTRPLHRRPTDRYGSTLSHPGTATRMIRAITDQVLELRHQYQVRPCRPDQPQWQQQQQQHHQHHQQHRQGRQSQRHQFNSQTRCVVTNVMGLTQRMHARISRMRAKSTQMLRRERGEGQVSQLESASRLVHCRSPR